jgi:hypothetical protein
VETQHPGKEVMEKETAVPVLLGVKYKRLYNGINKIIIPRNWKKAAELIKKL